MKKLKGIDYNDKEDLYEYTSHSNQELVYLVYPKDRKYRKNWTCTCKGFMFRKNLKKECKHITRTKFIDSAFRIIEGKMYGKL